MPKITALMPFFNGSKFLAETIESILAQTVNDWELLIVSEPGAEQEGLDIINQYALKDERIISVINDERMGISASLNKGLEMARGEYVARVDADDPSNLLRFQKQVKFMDANPDVSVCGSAQRALTPTGSSIQKMPCTDEEIKTALLFGCELVHCSLMLRRKDFIDHGWRYDSNYLSEDYQLWLRILLEAKFANLPEALVDHRWGFTNISLDKGQALKNETMELSAWAIQKYLGLNLDEADPYLFCGWRSVPKDYAKGNTSDFLKNGFGLLEEMERQNTKLGAFDHEALAKTIQRRWNWICSACGLNFQGDLLGVPIKATDQPPSVSVILPMDNCARYLRGSVDSIIKQTDADWELLAINEAGSDDGSAEIIKAYAKYDPRIRLIQNKEHLGLAESLNLGLRQARGRYVARLGVDGVAYLRRLAKQKDFLDRHPRIGACGAWQRHLRNGKEAWVHRPQVEPERCKANLLFWPDLGHSILMFRRDIFVENSLFYDSDFLNGDHELLTRALLKTGFANVPEVLNDYRLERQNISAGQRIMLGADSGQVAAAALERALGIKVSPEEQDVLSALNWTSRFLQGEPDRAIVDQKLAILKTLLTNVWAENKRQRVFDDKALLKCLQSVWGFARYQRPHNDLRYPAHSIEAVFDPHHQVTLREKFDFFCQVRPTFKDKTMAVLRQAGRQAWRPIQAARRRAFDKLTLGFIQALSKKIEQWTWDRFKRADKKIEQWTWDRFRRTDKKIEQWTWDRFKRTDKKIEQWTWKRTVHLEGKLRQMEKEILSNNTMLTDWSFDRHALFCKSGEKIKIGFFFQIPSFWPALESLYKACLNDERFEVFVIYCDENLDPSIKTEGVLDFLAEKGISGVSYKDFELQRTGLHVMVMQTIFDGNRPSKYNLQYLKSMGIRLVYCGYGVEFPDTNAARWDHYERHYYLSLWRIYTFSPKMLPYYNAYCRNSQAVRAFGTPRFDALYNREQFQLADDAEAMRGRRPIFLWKVHFPKVIEVGGKKTIITPELNEYLEFAAFLETRPDLFFIFMPHPRFVEFNQDKHLAGLAAALVDSVRALPNVYVDDNDDYRPSLVNADYILVDRSAVMVEAGAMGVPVIFLHNEDYKEPMTDAVAPLIESYYQGSTCSDMIDFVEMCLRGEDPKKEERLAAWNECMPLFDGHSSDRIKDDLFAEIVVSQESPVKKPVRAALEQVEEDDDILEYLLHGDNFKTIYHRLKAATFKHDHPNATTTYTGIPLISGEEAKEANEESWLRDIRRFDKQSLAFAVETLPYFYEYAAAHVPLGETYELLDIGSRTGTASNFLGQLFADDKWGFSIKLLVDTLDLNSDWNDHIKTQPFIREHFSSDIFDVPEKSYDFCFCSHTLEHVDDPVAFVRHMKKVARRFSFITCPFNESDPIPGHRTVTKEIIDQCEPLFFTTYKSVNRWRPNLECAVFIV